MPAAPRSSCTLIVAGASTSAVSIFVAETTTVSASEASFSVSAGAATFALRDDDVAGGGGGEADDRRRQLVGAGRDVRKRYAPPVPGRRERAVRRPGQLHGRARHARAGLIDHRAGDLRALRERRHRDTTARGTRQPTNELIRPSIDSRGSGAL